MRVVVLLLLCLLPASAALSAEENVLHVHTDLTMRLEPPGSGTTDGGVLTEPRTWTIPMEPALASATPLDPAGTVDFAITLGGSVHVGEVDVSVELHNGATLVAAGEEKHHELRTGYTTFNWNVAPLVDLVDPAAGNLILTIHASGTASSYFLDTDASRVALPVADPLPPADDAPQTVNITVEDDRVARDLSFNTTTNRTENIRWTHAPGAAAMRLAVNLTAGALEVRVADAHTVAFDASIDGPYANTTALEGLSAGTWNITLVFTGFIGEVSLVIEPLDPTGPADPDTNGTTDTPDPDDGPRQDSPFLGPVIGGLVLLALARRR